MKTDKYTARYKKLSRHRESCNRQKETCEGCEYEFNKCPINNGRIIGKFTDDDIMSWIKYKD